MLAAGVAYQPSVGSGHPVQRGTPLGRRPSDRQSTITDPLLVAVLIVSVAILLTRKVESLWVILGSAAVYLTAASLHLVAGL
jgi:hypothetical protein